ncbi:MULTISPECIES: hypothetical protein [unclassified Microbacterium]|uniref:hypothetical protein n=1 Tax=unclassified Microbacterium TaxID=2609290 RepID=UPI000D57CF62|nr:hypothetical protein [Microbacterium sp. Gd 4-13]PVW05413.1 hypothetical protein DEA06_06645 [Microbacterium sp. Gd 4-13]
MTTEISPPPPADSPPMRAPHHGGRTAPRVIALLTAALGVAVVAATVASAAVPALASASGHTGTTSLDVAGVRSLDLDVDATSFSVRFGTAAEATLDLQSVRGSDWRLERQGDTLRVVSPNTFGLWFGGGGGGTATLTLPRSLEASGIDAKVSFGGGGLSLEGAFDRLSIDMGGGQVTASGSAEDLTVDLGAGAADLELAGVRTADLSISAGRLQAVLDGAAPDDVRLSVSAGAATLTLPDAEYAVTANVEAGSFDNRLRTNTGSSHSVSVDVAAGTARVTSD